MRLRKALGAVLTAALLAAALLVLRPSERASAQLDPTGTWNIALSGSISASCTAGFTLAGTSLSADWACTTFGSGTLTGTWNKTASGATYDVSGTVSSPPYSVNFTASGSVAADGTSTDGTWHAPDYGYSGTFSGSRKGVTPAATATAVATTASTSTPTITPAYTPVPPADTPGGPTPTHTPSPAASPTPAGLPGDANCDHAVNSIDATLELQYIAALINSLACQHSADANGDGTVNAIDVTLILQYVAGLLNHLPP